MYNMSNTAFYLKSFDTSTTLAAVTVEFLGGDAGVLAAGDGNHVRISQPIVTGTALATFTYTIPKPKWEGMFGFKFGASFDPDEAFSASGADAVKCIKLGDTYDNVGIQLNGTGVEKSSLFKMIDNTEPFATGTIAAIHGVSGMVVGGNVGTNTIQAGVASTELPSNLAANFAANTLFGDVNLVDLLGNEYTLNSEAATALGTIDTTIAAAASLTAPIIADGGVAISHPLATADLTSNDFATQLAILMLTTTSYRTVLDERVKAAAAALVGNDHIGGASSICAKRSETVGAAAAADYNYAVTLESGEHVVFLPLKSGDNFNFSCGLDFSTNSSAIFTSAGDNVTGNTAGIADTHYLFSIILG